MKDKFDEVAEKVLNYDIDRESPEVAIAAILRESFPEPAPAEQREGVICPRCNGDGQLYYGDPESPEVAQCEECEGTGRLLAQPAPAEQGEGLAERAAILTAYWRGVADCCLGEHSDENAVEAVKDILPPLLASGSQPKAKVVPMAMLKAMFEMVYYRKEITSTIRAALALVADEYGYTVKE
jgi:hypothetical protein